MKENYRENPKPYWERNLKSKYGIAAEDYERLLAEQNYVCAVCKHGESRKGFLLGVDHDHATGSVRGLLCTKCNTAIGLMDDSPGLVADLLEYLKKYRQLQIGFPAGPRNKPREGKVQE